jgi:thiol-disulfide isomerase/thioredoxin
MLAVSTEKGHWEKEKRMGVALDKRRSIQADGDIALADKSTLLYFSSDECAPCRLQQAPAIDSLRQEMGERAQFYEYDAVTHPELAQQYRVLTVPTTVVVDPCGEVAAVNYGLTQAEKLQHQLDEADHDCD